MKKIAISPNEQETVISFMRSDKEASVFTSDPTIANKLDKNFKRHKEILTKGKLTGIEYLIPKNSIYFKAPKAKQNLSDEQKQKLLNRLQKK